jgi:AraC-like DNA-binding protein
MKDLCFDITLTATFKVIPGQTEDNHNNPEILRNLSKKLVNSIRNSPELLAAFIKAQFTDLLVNGDYFNEKFADYFKEGESLTDIIDRASHGLNKKEKTLLERLFFNKEKENIVHLENNEAQKEVLEAVLYNIIEDFHLVKSQLIPTMKPGEAGKSAEAVLFGVSDEMFRSIIITILFTPEDQLSKITEKSLAKEFEISPHDLSHIFIEKLGIEPGKFFDNVKLIKMFAVASLSKSTDIAGLAEMFGFDSESVCNQYFERFIGISLSDFIRLNAS